jgi:NAD(P)H-flavin reductase
MMNFGQFLARVPPTKLIRKVTLVEGETPDPHDKDRLLRLSVHALTFSIPAQESFEKPAIPHSNIQIDLGDVVKMVIPGYKPKSYSVSELREDEYEVTFKAYPNGRASGYLDRLKVGDTIQSFGKSANRIRNPGNFVGIIVFGIGITEGLPVAKAELEKDDADQVVLLWACRTFDDYFWHDKIEELLEKHGENFRLERIMSQDYRDGCLRGRVDPEVLDQVFQPADRDNARFLSVGTKEMMNTTYRMLAEIGYSMPRNALLPKRDDVA